MTMRRGQELRLDHVIDELQEQAIEARRVEQSSRLVDLAQLVLRPDFDEFLDRADAAGKADEGVGEFGHPLLAQPQRGRDLMAGEPRVRMAALVQALGDDAVNAAPGFEGRLCEDAHQAFRRSAIDQRDPRLRQCRAEPLRAQPVDVRSAEIGSAEYGDRLDRPDGHVSASLFSSSARLDIPARQHDVNPLLHVDDLGDAQIRGETAQAVRVLRRYAGPRRDHRDHTAQRRADGLIEILVERHSDQMRRRFRERPGEVRRFHEIDLQRAGQSGFERRAAKLAVGLRAWPSPTERLAPFTATGRYRTAPGMSSVLSILPPNAPGMTEVRRPAASGGAVPITPKNGRAGISMPQGVRIVRFCRSIARWIVRSNGKSSGSAPMPRRITLKPQSSARATSRISIRKTSPGSAPRTAIGPVRMCGPSSGRSAASMARNAGRTVNCGSLGECSPPPLTEFTTTTSPGSISRTGARAASKYPQCTVVGAGFSSCIAIMNSVHGKLSRLSQTAYGATWRLCASLAHQPPRILRIEYRQRHRPLRPDSGGRGGAGPAPRERRVKIPHSAPAFGRRFSAYSSRSRFEIVFKGLRVCFAPTR